MAAPAQQTGSNTKPTPTARIMLRLFFSALAIRWIYDIALYVMLGKNGIMTADSFGYMHAAESMAAEFVSGQMHGWAWLGPDVTYMPFLPWLAVFNVMMAGPFAPVTTVMTLGIFDAAACLLIYRTAALISPRFALTAGIAACINPTQIVLSGLLYTDTPFFFFVALWLLGAVQWLHAPSWKAALLIAVGLSGGALVRVVVVPWVAILFLCLLGAMAIKKTLARAHFVQFAVAGSIVLLCIAPTVTRNVVQYAAWSLTPQGGEHLAFWVVPLVKESYDGTPWADSVTRLQAEAKKDMPAEMSSTEFTHSAYLAQFGREQLKRFGTATIAKAWITGAVINLASPAIVLSPAVSKLPRTGFYDTRGSGIVDKIRLFLFRSDNKLYASILLAGIVGVAAIRLIQLIGVVALFRDRDSLLVLILFGLWIGYILAINGPIASPKYRLPIEPALVVLTGAGFSTLRDWRRKPSNRGQAAL